MVEIEVEEFWENIETSEDNAWEKIIHHDDDSNEDILNEMTIGDFWICRF